jgi:hypothetical protein
MGYRLYIGEINKEEHDKMQKMSYKYLVAKYNKGDESISNYQLVNELHGFGKYYDMDTSKYNHFFATEEIRKHFDENDFWIVDKEFLLSIIEKERIVMANWYRECTKKSHEELVFEMENLASEWEGKFGVCPYDLNLSKPNLIASWKRDYNIFDLVRIYKTFDFEKNHLVYYGW